MGYWNITVNGIGAHHNQDYEKDANKMFAKFIADMKAAGHQISVATFTYGSRDTIDLGSAYESPTYEASVAASS
jgi:hypothetical protein